MKKLKNIQSIPTLCSNQYDTTYHDDVLILQTFLPINLQAFHVKGY